MTSDAVSLDDSLRTLGEELRSLGMVVVMREGGFEIRLSTFDVGPETCPWSDRLPVSRGAPWLGSAPATHRGKQAATLAERRPVGDSAALAAPGEVSTGRISDAG